MPEENRNTYIYRVLRYTPNLVRDEWVNVGIVLQDPARNRVQARLIEETAELARVRRLHPNADEDLLRALPGDFSAQLGMREGASAYLEKLEQTLSNALQLSPRKAVLAEDSDAEMDRLYHDHVSPPHRARTGVVENTLGWIRMRISDAFRRHRILNNEKLTRGFRVEEFTESGDPFKLDYQYRANGTRGYVHALSLGRDPAQAKVLSYTAERIRAKQASSEFAAITEVEPGRDNPRHQFVARLLAAQQIRIVPLNRIEAFAEELRSRLN